MTIYCLDILLFLFGASLLFLVQYSAIKRNTFGSILMRWMNLEPIIQSEVSQKDKYHILTHIYGIKKKWY